ncbi:MAG: SPFH domain-containing protein [Verrucomicrobiota bacterium]|nr:SPFH domain-containing protein [Verrucomicrobiota bacterium]
MIAIIFFTALAVVVLGMALTVKLPMLARYALVVMSPILFILGLAIGSSVVVPPDQTGVIIRHFGVALPSGDIVAKNGEQGPQAEILGPGWHFGYIPFLYEVELAPVVSVDHGKLGFVTALDGRPLAADETYAPAWPNTADMLNPHVFLSKGGKRGPQISVLTPGVYRYNPRLHKIETIDALVVAPGTVAVIKSNSGTIPVEGDGRAKLVNGVPLVERGLRGVWREPLVPGAYYMNTKAYMPTMVKTTQRVYTYQQTVTQTTKTNAGNTDWSVTVRSKDGFSFPIDVRVACAVEASNAPYLVALLGNPDKVERDEQEDESLEVMEARVILPAIRAIFRNVAETMNALEFVNARSQVEKVAIERMRIELAKVNVTCDGVYVGNIHLDANEAGRKLISTQTDREVAVNQQTLYSEQRKAEEARANFVKAQEEAEQQRNLAKATYEVLVKEQGAKARAAEAKGESDYQIITGQGRAQAYEIMAGALGREQVAQLEMLRLVSEGKIQITPQVMVSGDSTGSGSLNALMGTMLRQSAPTTTQGPK